MVKIEHLNQLQQLLARRPLRTATLLDRLGISQPTFFRLWANVKNTVADRHLHTLRALEHDRDGNDEMP